MSKKNKKSTKRAQHAFDIRREKLEVVKKQLKVQKKEEKATPSKDSSKKKLKKGIRIRKGVQIRGIKITDAASKKKARETLQAEAAMRKMDVESNVDWEEAEASDVEQMED